jgi:hypothetical protein
VIAAINHWTRSDRGRVAVYALTSLQILLFFEMRRRGDEALDYLIGGPTRTAGRRRAGISVSAISVRAILIRHGLPPAAQRDELSWRDFLRQHAATTLACDFFIVETAWLRRIYVLFFLSLGSRRVGGRPGRRCEYVHRRETSWRCQRSSASGLIGKTGHTGRGTERLSDASSARSARVSFGRAVCRRRIASSCRRTRISSSFERRGRPSSHTSANRLRTTRYTNDQSKQPSPRPRQQRRT